MKTLIESPLAVAIPGNHREFDMNFRRVIKEVCGGIFETSKVQDCHHCDLRQCLNSEYSRAIIGEDSCRRIKLLNETYCELNDEVEAALALGEVRPETAQIMGELQNLGRQIVSLMRLARNRRTA